MRQEHFDLLAVEVAFEVEQVGFAQLEAFGVEGGATTDRHCGAMTGPIGQGDHAGVHPFVGERRMPGHRDVRGGHPQRAPALIAALDDPGDEERDDGLRQPVAHLGSTSAGSGCR